MRQLWKCNTCSTHRQWGTAAWETVKDVAQTVALLICDVCEKATEHSFLKDEESSYWFKGKVRS